jgi:teichoic acid transport system ATP-binding protein
MQGLTGERNIMIGGLALGLSKREVRERFDEIVEFAGIGDFVYLPMQAYSSGMGARLRFAISSAARPDILLIDEALATGDADFREKSKARIDEIRQHAGTVFLVSHSLAAIQQMCSRVLWIHDGQLRMDGPTKEVCKAYAAFSTPRPAEKK